MWDLLKINPVCDDNNYGVFRRVRLVPFQWTEANKIDKEMIDLDNIVEEG